MQLETNIQVTGNREGWRRSVEVSNATSHTIGNRQQGRVETLCGGVVCN